MARLLLLTLVTFGLIGFSRAQDPLDEAGRQLTLKAQRVVREVQLSFAQARALERSNPERAREVLRNSKALLEEDYFLPEQQRRDLLQQVNSRLASIGNQVSAAKRAKEDAGRETAERVEAEQRVKNANKAAAQNGPAAVAAGRIGSTKEVLARIDEMRAQRGRATLSVFDKIDVAATPIDGYIEYPKYWKQITDARQPKLDPQEVAVLKALNSTLSVDFKQTPFKDVIEYLQEKTGQSIIVDENALRDSNLDSSDPVNFKVSKVTFRTILRKVLADRGLGYIIKEGAIEVMSAQRARETTVTRSYPVSDLIVADPTVFGVFTPLAMQQNAVNLVNMIITTVEPSYWQVNGGPGTITYHPQTQSIVVRASAEMHYMFGGTGVLRRR